MKRGALITAVALVVVLLCACGITSACAPSSPGYTVVHHYHHDSGSHGTSTKKATKKPSKKPTKKASKR